MKKNPGLAALQNSLGLRLKTFPTPAALGILVLRHWEVFLGQRRWECYWACGPKLYMCGYMCGYMCLHACVTVSVALYRCVLCLLCCVLFCSVSFFTRARSLCSSCTMIGGSPRLVFVDQTLRHLFVSTAQIASPHCFCPTGGTRSQKLGSLGAERHAGHDEPVFRASASGQIMRNYSFACLDAMRKIIRMNHV